MSVCGVLARPVADANAKAHASDVVVCIVAHRCGFVPFDGVARSLGAGLEERPETTPSGPSVLDRYERLIEATRLAGREQEAFDL